MKKRNVIVIVFVLQVFWLAESGFAQNLLDVYRSGTLKLVADPEFMKDADWDKLFDDYPATAYGRPVGKNKDMVIASDGSIFIKNHSKYNVYKFDRFGNFIKSFGQQGRRTGDFWRRPDLTDSFEDKLLITHENNGRINLFDTDGNFLQLIEMDYMPTETAILDETTIAVVGFVPYSGPRIRRVVAIKDVNSGEENIISSVMQNAGALITTELKNVGVRTVTVNIGRPFSRTTVSMVKTPDNNLVVGYSDSPVLTFFSPTGIKIREFEIRDSRKQITEQDKEEYFESLKNSYSFLPIPGFLRADTATIDSLLAARNLTMEIVDELKKENFAILDKTISEIKSGDFFPEYMPYYYTLLVDSDGNLLVFVYTDEGEPQKFHVYSPNGEYICETVLDTGEFNIEINARMNNLVFHKGDLYCIAELKEAEGVPLRIIEVNLSGRN